MSKLSFKNEAIQSSVVVLKDGSCLEVRRGAKTKWSPGEERGRWPSVAAWTATLPAGATPTKTDKAIEPPQTYNTLKNPILRKILGAVQRHSKDGSWIPRPYVSGQIFYDKKGTRSVVYELDVMNRVNMGMDVGLFSKRPDAVSRDAVGDRIKVLQNKLGEITEGASHPGWYIRGHHWFQLIGGGRTLTSDFFLEYGSGKMYSIFWNMKEEVVMVWIPTRGLVPIRDLGMTDEQIMNFIWHMPRYSHPGPSMYRI
jgi:hypothetical protein